LFQDLNEIQKKLMAGISRAMEAAQRLLQALTEMMASLGRAGSQAGMSPFGRLSGGDATARPRVGQDLI